MNGLRVARGPSRTGAIDIGMSANKWETALKTLKKLSSSILDQLP